MLEEVGSKRKSMRDERERESRRWREGGEKEDLRAK